MPSYRKSVLREIRTALPRYLPAFRPANFDADENRKKDALFVATGPTRTFGLWVEFSSKRPGDFTGELLVITSPGKQTLSCILKWPDEFHPENDGIYRVGPFIGGFDRWWQLRDHETETLQFFRSLDPAFPAECVPPSNPHHWRPRDFSVPLEVRITEAADDFLTAIRDHIVPKLPI